MLRDKDPDLNDKLAGYIDEFLTATAEGGNWYKDELRRNRQELAYLREYREYVENNFEESSNLLRQNADLTAEFAEQDTLAELEKIQAEILAEAAIRRAARAKASEPSAKEPQSPETIPIPNVILSLPKNPIPDPTWGPNGVSTKAENLPKTATTAALTQNRTPSNTPKNNSQHLGSGPRLNRAQRRKLEREAAKNKLRAA